MKPRPNQEKSPQQELFRQELEQLVDPGHVLVKLAYRMNWEHFDKEFGTKYNETTGRPAINTKLMASVHYLKYAFNLSDEDTLSLWEENPCWQYFSGMIHFQHHFPFDSSSMTCWRKRMSEKGAEQLLKETINAGIQIKAIRPTQLQSIHLDSTVSEKNITYPTEAKLSYKSLQRLVKEAKKDGLELRQSYKRVSKQALRKSQGHTHGRQMNRARKEVKKLKNYLGRIVRDIKRKAGGQMSEYLKKELELAERLLKQTLQPARTGSPLHSERQKPQEIRIWAQSKHSGHNPGQLGNRELRTGRQPLRWAYGNLHPASNRKVEGDKVKGNLCR